MVVDGLASAPYEWQAEVVLHATLDDVRSVVSATVGTLEEVGDGVLLRLGANELDWIARYLSGLPFTFEVRSPAQLRTALRDLARRLRQGAAAKAKAQAQAR
jgi:predicted DNA-binding transcriptional regulator YafY